MLLAGVLQSALNIPPNTHDKEEGARKGMTSETPHVQHFTSLTLPVLNQTAAGSLLLLVLSLGSQSPMKNQQCVEWDLTPPCIREGWGKVFKLAASLEEINK